MSDAHAALEHYLANALSTDERLAFEAHATSCASCTREIANWRSFGTVLKAQLAPVRRAPTRAEVAELISLADEPRTLWPRWLLPTLVAASAVVAVTVVSLALRSRSAPEEWSPTSRARPGCRRGAERSAPPPRVLARGLRWSAR